MQLSNLIEVDFENQFILTYFYGFFGEDQRFVSIDDDSYDDTSSNENETIRHQRASNIGKCCSQIYPSSNWWC